jgi:hypothetical protein
MSDENTGEDQSPFSALVGENKKFKTPEDLAKGKLEADSFIERLQREKKEMEEELTRLRVQKEVEAKTKQPETSPTSQAPSDVEALIERKLKEAKQTESRQANLKGAEHFLTETYGDQAEKVLKDQAREMGIDTNRLLDLAADTPALFKKLFAGTAKKMEPTATSGTQNTEAMDLSGPSGEVSEYRQLSQKRKEMGTSKFFGDPKNLQRLIDAKKKELGS